MLLIRAPVDDVVIGLVLTFGGPVAVVVLPVLRVSFGVSGLREGASVSLLVGSACVTPTSKRD